LERQSHSTPVAPVDVAELQRSTAGLRRDLLKGHLEDVEVAGERLCERFATTVVEPPHEAMGGKDGQSWVLQRHQAHEDVAVLALATQLLGIGLVALED